MNAKTQPDHLAAATRFADKVQAVRNVADLYAVANAGNFTAGWAKKRDSLWPAPTTSFKPMHWRYADARAVLERAGEYVGTDLAERRNLIMFNPVGDNEYASVRTLITAYQMIKAGEHAKTHRHTPNALRLVTEAQPGVFTIVDGVKVPMLPGDVALTPGWSWHSHYHDGEGNAYWVDYLDVPLVHLLEPMFFERLPGERQAETGDAVDHPYYFPDATIKASLARAPASASGSRTIELPCPSMPTMKLQMHALDRGGAIVASRTTASHIFTAVAGAGIATIGDARFEWTRGDTLVAPSWTPFRFESDAGAQLFQVSDEPTLAKLGLLRAESGRP